MKKLNLGCGKDIKKGYINLDCIKLPGVDIVHNINKKFPFKNNTFDEVYCSHVLEHVDNLIFVLEEIWRTTKPNGRVLIKVPFFPSLYAVSDPTHKHFFTYFTFDYFTPNNNLNYYSKARFNILKKRIDFSWNKWINFLSFFINLTPRLYNRYFSFILPSNQLYFELEVVK